jgi:hypothetical protein
MKFGTIICATLVGIVGMSSQSLGQQKTAKACQAEWRANKDDNQAKGITEKAYVDQCRAGGAPTQPAAVPAPQIAPPPAPRATAPPRSPAPSPTTAAPDKPTATARPAPSAAPTPAWCQPICDRSSVQSSLSYRHGRVGQYSLAHLSFQWHPQLRKH